MIRRKDLSFLNKYPPAEPEVLRLLAPQRGLIATGQSQKQDLVSYRPARVFVIGVKRTPGFVELLLPPRQSRGISLRNRIKLADPAQVPREVMGCRLTVGQPELCTFQGFGQDCVSHVRRIGPENQ